MDFKVNGSYHRMACSRLEVQRRLVVVSLPCLADGRCDRTSRIGIVYAGSHSIQIGRLRGDLRRLTL